MIVENEEWSNFLDVSNIITYISTSTSYILLHVFFLERDKNPHLPSAIQQLWQSVFSYIVPTSILLYFAKTTFWYIWKLGHPENCFVTYLLYYIPEHIKEIGNTYDLQTIQLWRMTRIELNTYCSTYVFAWKYITTCFIIRRYIFTKMHKYTYYIMWNLLECW